MDDSANRKGSAPRLIGPEAKERFLGAVRGGARLGDAAAAAGFSLHGFYGARRRDPVFARAWGWVLELSAVEEKIGSGADRAPPAGEPPDETRVAPNNGRRLQRRRMRHVRFTEKRRGIFLAHFAATCDAQAAAEAASVDESTVYKHRQRDAAFAEAFQEALEIGYARLEAEALRQRLEAQAKLREGILPVGEIAQEFERVLKLLQRWDRRGGKVGPRAVAPGRMKRWTFDEAITLLGEKLDKLDAVPGLPSPASGADE